MPRPDRGVGWPVLLVLLAFLAGSAYLVWRVHESTAATTDPSAPVPGLRSADGAAVGGQDSYRHHSWTEDAGSAPPGPAAADPGRGDQVYDPQRWRMLRSFGVENADAGVPMPFEAVELAAEITSSSGAIGVADDAACAIRVLPAREASFNCSIRVMCAGHVIYPNPSQTAGYVECVVSGGRVVRAEDRGHTAVDGDPRLRLDLERGTVTVEDRGDRVERFSLSLRVRR